METGLQEIWEIKAREVLKEKYRAQVRNEREIPYVQYIGPIVATIAFSRSSRCPSRLRGSS